MEVTRLSVLIDELRTLALEARLRADEGCLNDPPPDFWHDVQFGFELAADRLEALQRESAGGLHG